ncbi:autophagy protein 16 [Cucurbitaria berberidis CBS 394.84]|uniref:Autophagy protein 16 n=1 Tax=Cucurbitaria berberidis CBS 394.84 TaxID=1168544 RepID=A0A9P4GQN4_9PLEO|nr:autophagy protein 16 [Cucurbitaria berberidis CBS 394.84]KAF1849549.1 autophagy protein 16 [Cucurbitaria berberidis CBS 394.84]
MSNPLAEYLSALESRDAREKTHEEYINAYTKLADRTSVLANQTPSAAEEPSRSPSVSTRTIRPSTPSTPRSKGGIAPSDVSSPSTLAQIRSELASTQRTRSELETKLSTLNTELSTLKSSDLQQRQRIDQLERVRTALERRGKDRADELKGKGRFVEEVQDEMVALNLQLNMAEQEKEKLKKENEDLTRRWVQKMEEEARKMNDRMGWEEQGGRKKGSRS